MSTFMGRPVNSRFNQYRKQQVRVTRGPAYTYLAVKTNDLTGSVNKMRYEFKGTITSKLLTESYQQVDPDTFIGEKDFVVIYKECWR